jgi:hypothetical protein
MCAVQRFREAESRIEMQAVKWTAEGMVKSICYLDLAVSASAEYSMT